MKDFENFIKSVTEYGMVSEFKENCQSLTEAKQKERKDDELEKIRFGPVEKTHILRST